MLLPPFNFPTSQQLFLFITDTSPSSSASFLLYKALVSHFKSSSSSSSSSNTAIISTDGSDERWKKNKKRKATIVSVSEDLIKWKSVTSRFNFNIGRYVDSGEIEFINALENVSPSPGDTSKKNSGLRPLFDLIERSITTSSSTDGTDETERLVIIDDISTLEWIGFELNDVWKFVRAIVALSRRMNTTLMIRHHLIPDSESGIDDLFRNVIKICSYHIEVRALESGRSGAVSGEIALHPGPSMNMNKDKDRVRLIPRSSALQYRLTDANTAGVEYFERGTGVVVL